MKEEDEKKKNDGKRPEKMLTRTKSVCHVLYRQAGKLSMATHNKTRLSGERIYWGRGRNHKQLPHLGFWEGPTSRARGKGWRKAKYWLLRLICDSIDLERVFCSRNAGGLTSPFLLPPCGFSPAETHAACLGGPSGDTICTPDLHTGTGQRAHWR